jgi:hypothetical protein
MSRWISVIMMVVGAMTIAALFFGVMQMLLE